MIATVAMVAPWPCACGELDIIDHDPLLLEPEGNFPEDVQERCGPLPLGVEPIPGLTSAWAMTKVPVEDGTSLRAATTSMVLRLSDDGVPCGEPLDAESLDCPQAWAVDLTLRSMRLGPGTFELVDHAQGFHLATAKRQAGGACGRDQELGSFEAGQIEIFTITDDCVVGQLVQTTDALADAGSPVEGGFVALRCEPAE